MALFGQSSGSVPPFDPSILNARGSLFLTRPNLAHHLLDRQELLWRAGDVLKYVASGVVKVRISGTYPLAEAAEAHQVLEGRKTTGKLLLKVDGRS
jgi:NADPH2:quinone reductase